MNYERNAAIVCNTKLNMDPFSSVQHIADNADHNTCTLDENVTFHGMAIIAAITPHTNRAYPVVPRGQVL